MVTKYGNWLVVVRLLTEGGTLKRIILSATVVVLAAALLAVSSLASVAQEDGGQYASDVEYAPTTTAVQSPVICAPWSNAWDLSNGKWVYQYYRWCVDTSLYNPAVESSWSIEWGNTVQGEQANLCPEKGTCTVSPEGGMRMSTTTDPADTQPPPTTTSPSTTPTTTNPVDTQPPPTTTSPSATPTTITVDPQTPTTITVEPQAPPTTTSPSTTPTTTNPLDTQMPASLPYYESGLNSPWPGLNSP